MERQEKKPESLHTSMCLGRQERLAGKSGKQELDAGYVDALYARIKSHKVLREDAECSEHVRTALDMENDIKKAKESERLEVLNEVFVNVIKADPYYGRVLSEIKKGFDSLKENAVDEYRIKTLEREILTLKSQNITLANENRTLRRENDLLKDDNKMLKREATRRISMENTQNPKISGESLEFNTQFKSNTIHSHQHQNEQREKKEMAQVKQLSPHMLDVDKPQREKIGARNKSVAVPRLDLSKVRNKYAGERIVVAQPRSCLDKKDSSEGTTLAENKSLLNDLNGNGGKFKNWKDLNSLYVELCGKTGAQTKDLLEKFKRGVY